MEYSVQIMEKRTYHPSEALKALHKLIGKYNKFVPLLIQEYLKEIVELEQNSDERIIFDSYVLTDKDINEKNFDLVIGKYIKPINPESQLIYRSKLYNVLHETFELFPNLFKMYCDEHQRRALYISAGPDEYSYHSNDNGMYENWVVEKCLGLNH